MYIYVLYMKSEMNDHEACSGAFCQVPRVSDALVPSFLRSALEESEERPSKDDEPMLTVLDSQECQSKSSQTKFPGHLLDVVEPWLTIK